MRSYSASSIIAATLLSLTFVVCGLPLQAQAEDASPSPSPSLSPAPAKAAPTPVPLDKVPSEAESAFSELRQIEEIASTDRTSLESTSSNLSNFTTEIHARLAEDNRILAGTPSLELLYQLRTGLQTFADGLSSSEQDLNQRATTLGNRIVRLSQMDQIWHATIQSAPQVDMPPAVLQRVQNVVDEIKKSEQTAQSDRAEVLTLQSNLLTEEARIQSDVAAITRSQSQALKDLLVRDGQPIWTAPRTLTSEWQTQSRETFSSQWVATRAFVQRLPSSFVLHAMFIALFAIFIQWLRHRVRKLTEVKPELQQALPILDLPVSTAFVLSTVVIPSVYLQAPRGIQAILGAVALVPTVLILRRLLQRNLFPILYALVGLYFITQLRVLAASLPVLARFLFLVETLGGFVFLVWLLRSGALAAAAAGTTRRFSRALRFIARIGLVIFPAAILANAVGYVNLANLVGDLYVRSIFVAALFYVIIRVLEGLLIIGLQVRPLGALRAVQLHREMLHQRICRILEFLALLLWLDLVLNFFGLRNPLLAKIGEVLNANVAIGSIDISLGRILAFAIAVWASFLVSKFVRFLLEADVFQHFRLERGLPYAISTVLHYSILLVGFFIALGALGIDLTKITILAGAFSVGVGFGLQNVINNFVSGLILLFERPIKLGDVIEIGGTVGEVRRIGIRACVVRTADGSEIIVPNGSLISNQVTNWTFSDRVRAVEISVNILPGTDSQRVVELLKTAAVNYPGIAKEPAPQVYVMSFTAGATTFQLRAWTDRYRDWTQVRSDLAVAVNDTLVREKIGIA
ncbi:MAG: mechanosensitive ion channel [Verrucomicrobia bacterium]|nr:mechanosensitive ion channel [Verrucomicrobiota bacterium]MBV8484646.1 mechanosensitive ion channel [Verrucomicrobiota bacterium]